ncbi:hypothetical protein GQ457_12G006960 [Hibiscus cannabinus]
MSVTGYEIQFVRLSQYAPELVPTERDRCDRFRYGLVKEVKTYMLAYDYTDFDVLVARAKDIEQSLGLPTLASGSSSAQNSAFLVSSIDTPSMVSVPNSNTGIWVSVPAREGIGTPCMHLGATLIGLVMPYSPRHPLGKDRRHSKGHSDESRSPPENSQPPLFSLHLFHEPSFDPKQSKPGLKSRGHGRSVSSLLIGGCDRWIAAAPKYVVSLVERYFLTVGDRHWSLRSPEKVEIDDKLSHFLLFSLKLGVVAGLRSSVWVVLELAWLFRLGGLGVEGCCHGNVRWWVRWFNGDCRMKVVKWNDGFVMKMKGIRDDDF